VGKGELVHGETSETVNNARSVTQQVTVTAEIEHCSNINAKEISFVIPVRTEWRGKFDAINSQQTKLLFKNIFETLFLLLYLIVNTSVSQITKVACHW
jgi:hypothetical protein